MVEDSLIGKFWMKEGHGLLKRKRREKWVRISYDDKMGKATLEVASVSDISTITTHHYLDHNRCLLMTERSSRKGKLALVPSVTSDMGKGLVLEQRDQHALQIWEERLRKHLRVVSYPVVIATKHHASKPATLHISPTRLYLSRGFPPKFSYLGSWDIALYAKNVLLINNGIRLDVNYDGAENLTLMTEYAGDIYATVKGCFGKIKPVQEPKVNIEKLVPPSRRRFASMPTSIRNELSLRLTTSRNCSI